MTNSRHLGEMKECLQCSQCRNSFDERPHTPVLLDCLHSICMQCVERMNLNESIECPICNFKHKVSYNGIAGLQTDKRWEIYKRYLQAVSEHEKISCGNCKTSNNPVVLFCKQCSFFLCSDCEKVHNVWSDFQKHTTTVITNLNIDEILLCQFAVFSKCKEHKQQELKFYCTAEGCSRPICAECCIVQHQSHIYVGLEDHVNILKVKVKESLEKLEKKVVGCRQESAKYETENERLTKLEIHLCSEIDDAFGKCIKLLQGRREYLKGDIRSSLQEKRSAIQTTIEQCKKFESSCQYLKHYWRTIKQTEDLCCLTEIGPKVLKRLQDFCYDKSTTDPPNFPIIQVDFNQVCNSVKDLVKTLGETKKFSISPMYSFIEIPKEVFQNKSVEIFLHLKEDSEKLPSKSMDGVTLVVSSCKEDEVKLKTKWLEDGRYLTQWTPVEVGQYSFHVLIQETDTLVPSAFILVQEKKETEKTETIAQLTGKVQAKDSKEVRLPKSENIGKCCEVQTENKTAASLQGGYSHPDQCPKEDCKCARDNQKRNQLSNGFGNLQKEHHITEKAVKTKRKEVMENTFRLKPLPDIPWKVKCRKNEQAWDMERRPKPIPSLDWLNLSSGSEKADGNDRRARGDTTADKWARGEGPNRRPYSAVGLLPRRQALSHSSRTVIRRSKTEMDFRSLESLDDVDILDFEKSVFRIRNPSVYFDVTTLHRDRCMAKDHRVLSNKEMWGIPKQLLAGKHLKNYTGALLNTKLTKDTVGYFQFHVEYRIFRDLKASNLICEVAINKRREIDTSESSFFRNSGWSLQICRCIDCYKVCLFAHCNATYIHKTVSNDNAGTACTCAFGLYVNARQRTIQLVDTTRDELIGRFLDVDVADEDVIAFGVYNPSRLDVTVTVESGSDVPRTFRTES